MEEVQASGSWAGYVDWRNRPALRGKHGGMLAASFVLAVKVLENLAFLSNASNLVRYLVGFMHFSHSRAANTVTTFMGTAFLLALLGGFLTDAIFTAYRIYPVSAVVEFLGLIVLSVQAHTPSLMPPKCDPKDPGTCEEASGGKAAMLFAGLYVVALGVGGIKGSLPAHGAEQFDEDTEQGRKDRSTFFNYYVFCLSCGALIAVTFVVWMEDNMGWQWGFAIATIAIVLSIPVFLAGTTTYRNRIPTGSPLTTILKVTCAAVFNTETTQNPSNEAMEKATKPFYVLHMEETNGAEGATPNAAIQQRPSEGLRCLNKAAERKPFVRALACTVEEVEDVKVVVRILPIFFCTIMLNCCLAQLSTFSVQQASTMDRRVGSLTVPPASLPFFPVVFIMVLAPLYHHLIIPFARRVTKTETGITHLQRGGVGLALSIVAMGIAAVVEVKRKGVASHLGMIDSKGPPLPITFFWIVPQYLLLGSADLFILAGLMEFFFTEAPWGMRSLATSLSWASLAMGYYLSSALVSIVNGATGNGGHSEPWLAGSNLNHYRLERFYGLMCLLSVANFLHYLFWASRYEYRSLGRKG